MSSSTQAIGQSLFDFLDGKNAFEKLDAIRNGELGREINRYVHDQLERFHIGSFQDSLGEQLTGVGGSHAGGAHGGWSTGDAVVFGAVAGSTGHGNGHGHGHGDLVGGEEHQVHSQVDLSPSLGGMDSDLVGESHPTEQIFKSHRG
jgi:hypothetical protein